jgi:hypothetical protein
MLGKMQKGEWVSAGKRGKRDEVIVGYVCCVYKIGEKVGVCIKEG